MKDKELRNLQLLELELAVELDRICKTLKIQYFLIGGTFLGAVRHHGFIPWDDDMDVGMLRNDYEHFMREAPELLGEDFYLQNWDVDKEYPFSFAKLRLNGTEVTEKMNSGINTHKGVFLDIFPFDNVPENENSQKRQAISAFVLKKLLWIKKGYGKSLTKNNLKFAIKYYLGRFASAVVPYSLMKNIYHKELIRYNNQPTEYVFCSCLYKYRKSWIKREWAENLVQYDFEGHAFPAAEKYDDFLSNLFGDYMKIPPVEKRHTHEIESVSLNEKWRNRYE